MLPSLLIILGILLTALAVTQVILRRTWVRDRAEVATVLDMTPDALAGEHPSRLNERLNRIRVTEAIHTDYLRHDTVRERDRESARIHVERAREAAGKVRVAMAASVKTRVDSGVVVPSMPGVEVGSTVGVGHE